MSRHLEAEILLNLRILMRLPGFWVPTVIFPGMLYAFFGVQNSDGIWAVNSMASFCIYAVLGVGFFQFGVSVAQDRESPFDRWQRSLPGSVMNQWVARVFVSLIFCLMSVLLVIAIALALTSISLGFANWIGLGLVCLISVVPATLMGIALGSLTSARTAVAIANLIFLPLAYLGGLWLPPIAMPQFIEKLSRWTPTRSMGELSWSVVSTHPTELRYIVTLLVWTGIALAIISVANLRSRK